MNHSLSKRPKAIFFDLDETLVENKIPVQQLFARMYFDFEDQLGADNKDVFFKNMRSQISTLWGTMFDISDSPEKQLVSIFAKSIQSIDALSIDASHKLAQDMFEHYGHLSSHNVVLHDGALETLAQLSELGFTTGLITNGIEAIQLGKVYQLGLHHKVDHVTVSAQARAHKPYAPVFELALTRAEVAAQHAWQIGDHATNDVAGAIRAGMGGVFYNPRELLVEDVFAEIDEAPTHVIRHLLEIVDLAQA